MSPQNLPTALTFVFMGGSIRGQLPQKTSLNDCFPPFDQPLSRYSTTYSNETAGQGPQDMIGPWHKRGTLPWAYYLWHTRCTIKCCTKYIISCSPSIVLQRNFYTSAENKKRNSFKVLAVFTLLHHPKRLLHHYLANSLTD